MEHTIENFGDELAKRISTADDVFLAVGLITESGLDKLEQSLEQARRVKVLVGVDMPSTPDALTRLLRLQLKGNLTACIYDGPEYFHPKVFLIKKRNSFVSYVGSANLTGPALAKNVEMTLSTGNRQVYKNLHAWFSRRYHWGLPISATVIADYRAVFDEREEQRQAAGRPNRASRRTIREAHQTAAANRSTLLEAIQKAVGDRAPTSVARERRQAIRRLRTAIGYPQFRRIDLDAYYEIQDLGRLIAIDKPRVASQQRRLRRMLRVLCDERVPIEERYQRAVHGRLKVNGAGEAFVTKVLAIHNPRLYCIQNRASRTALKRCGVSFPHGVSPGERYAMTARFLADIAIEAGLPNMAVLDYYLWTLANDAA